MGPKMILEEVQGAESKQVAKSAELSDFSVDKS